jgi:CYTH domain-containing protein
VAIDELHDRLHGVVLAEVELRPEEPRLPLPFFAVHDVTNDDRFSGGALAAASGEVVAMLLRQIHAPRAESD